MTELYSTYKTNFGQLTVGHGPENNFLWTCDIDISNEIFGEKIPIFIFTKEQRIPENLIDFIETIVSDIDQYLEKSILFIKQTLTEQKEIYKITEDEFNYLKLDINNFPIDLPELTFWEDTTDWMIRFAEGKFSICDPLGISVNYNRTNPISVENLENSEFIGD